MGVGNILMLGLEHHKAGRMKEAWEYYDLAAEKFPNDHQPPYLMGTLCLETNQDGLATNLLMHALSISKANGSKRAEIANNLGIVLRRCGHEKGALDAYKLSLEWEPNNAAAVANMSGFYVNQGNPDACIEWSEKTLILEPDNIPAKSHKAIALLEKGDYENGFKQYQVRCELPGYHRREYGCELWDGGAARLLAVHGEQGVGDEVMFTTFLREAQSRVGAVVVECEPRLVPLFERSFGVPCYGTHEELMAAGHKPDAYCPMGSLPVHCWPPEHGHLRVDLDKADEYRKRLEAIGPGPYIGLSWKGGTKSTHMHLRNPGFEGWQSLVTKPATFVSLQYGEAAAGAEILGIPHWADAIDSLDNQAALLAALDLHISVCNSSIHLAGGVGTPCWVLTPYKAAWRYGLTGRKMLCYDSVSLFRQDEAQRWEPVFAEIMREFDDKFMRRAA